jgi:glutathione S-transferase
MAGYRLYGWRQTGSMAIEAALAEAGVPYDFVPVSRATDENLGPSFTAVNPRQQLPALVLPDGTVVTEGPAILAHIADAFPDAGLAPERGSSARAMLDRWTAFFHANVYEAMLRELKPASYTDDPAGAGGIRRAATAYVKQHFEIFEGQLGPGPFLLGDRLSSFDIYLWMLCHWVERDWLQSACPGTARLLDAASARPLLAEVARKHFG